MSSVSSQVSNKSVLKALKKLIKAVEKESTSASTLSSAGLNASSSGYASNPFANSSYSASSTNFPQFGNTIPTNLPISSTVSGFDLQDMSSAVDNLIAQTGGGSSSNLNTILSQADQTGGAATTQQNNLVLQMSGLTGSSGIFSGNPTLNNELTSSMSGNAGLAFGIDDENQMIMQSTQQMGQEIDAVATGQTDPNIILNAGDTSQIESTLPQSVLQYLPNLNNSTPSVADLLAQQATGLSTGTTPATGTTASTSSTPATGTTASTSSTPATGTTASTASTTTLSPAAANMQVLLANSMSTSAS